MRYILFLTLGIIFFTACQSVPMYQQKFDMAKHSWDMGNKNEAIQLLQESLQENPEFYEGRMELANYYFEIGKYKEACEQYEFAIELQKENPEPWILAGESYLKLARTFQDAEERATTFLKAQHKFSNTLEMRDLSKEGKFRATLGKGICLLYRTLKEDAREYIEDAVRMQPEDISVKFHWAMLLEQQQGPNRKSLDIYQKILAIQPDYVDVLKQLGDFFRTLGYEQTACGHYQDFLKYGGKSNEIQEWVDKHKITINPEISDIIMVCPSCGRIGKKGQKTCDFDGVDLIAQTKS